MVARDLLVATAIHGEGLPLAKGPDHFFVGRLVFLEGFRARIDFCFDQCHLLIREVRVLIREVRGGPDS